MHNNARDVARNVSQPRVLSPRGARRAPCCAPCAAPTDGAGDLIALHTASKDNRGRAALCGEREGHAVTAHAYVAQRRRASTACRGTGHLLVFLFQTQLVALLPAI